MGTAPTEAIAVKAVGFLSLHIGILPARHRSLSWALSAFPGFWAPQCKGVVLWSCPVLLFRGMRWREY